MRERWLSRRAVFLHVGCLIFVPFCIAATWWQITRAEDGNGLSLLYTFEWPIFAAVGIYFWWQFLHTDYDTVGLKGMRNQTEEAPTGGDSDITKHLEPAIPRGTMSRYSSSPSTQLTALEDEDPELAAYNARLAALSTSGRKTWKKPETHVARRPQ